MNKEVLDLLIYSFDSELSSEEALQLEKALAASAELRLEKERIVKTRQLMESFDLGPDHTFVNSVMKKIKRKVEPAFNRVIIQLFPKVAAACLLLFLITLLGVYVTEGNLSADAIIGIEEISIEEALSLIEI